MSNNIPATTPTIFNFDNSQIRTVTVDGEPWFVAADVAATLGYTNTSKAINDHCKGVTKRYIPTTSGTQEMNTIPERDVYRLIMKSQLPTAERFEEWVVGEVLPTIRKTGGYHLPQTYTAALEQLLVEVRTREANQHKVDFYNAVAETSDLILIRDVAKTLAVPQMGQNMLFKQLRRLGVLLEDNTPYQRYVDRGYFMIRIGKHTRNNEQHIHKTTMVTQKGLDFIRRIIIQNMQGGLFKSAPADWQLPPDDREPPQLEC